MQASTVLTEPITRTLRGPIEGERRFLINNVSWSQYEQLLEVFGDHRLRITYCDGMIELMSPGRTHEEFGGLLGRMVEALTEELDIPLKALGSTTLRRQAVEKGLEADRSYYLTNAYRLGPLDQPFDLETIPPPDLVIEVEITSALLGKLAIYAALGVPEVWRHDGRTLRVLLLQPDRTYVESPQSRAFPFLPMAAFARKLQDLDPINDTRWAKAFRVWVREVVAPLHQP